ncbi:MAG: CpXC domain-containing protein [Solobacterium sp.]|nr:CpXC domain-containing protein [Solobacterium sp.]
MNESRTISYTCPYCGRELGLEVFDSVIADDSPDLRDRCLSGDLFRVSCPHCKQEYMVQYPLVYIDRARRFVLFLNENEELPMMVKNLAETLVKAGYRLRRTPTLAEFTEKIQIFEDDVDDRLVELAKYDSLIEFIDNKKGSAADVTAIDYQRTENGVMKINVRTGDKGMSFLIPLTMIEEELNMSPERYELNADFPVVNAAWLIDLFEPKPDEKSLN